MVWDVLASEIPIPSPQTPNPETTPTTYAECVALDAHTLRTGLGHADVTKCFDSRVDILAERATDEQVLSTALRGSPALIRFSLGLINLHLITMNEKGPSTI